MYMLMSASPRSRYRAFPQKFPSYTFPVSSLHLFQRHWLFDFSHFWLVLSVIEIHINEIMLYALFVSGFFSLNKIFWRFHIVCITLVVLYCRVALHCIHIPDCLYFISQWTFGLFFLSPIMNKAAINVPVLLHIFSDLWSYLSFEL